MSDPNALKHRLIIAETGKIQPNGTAIEVHSRGGSLFGMKRLIDEFSQRGSYGIKTVYNNELGAGYLDVILSDSNAEEVAVKLDTLIASHTELDVQGYFEDALAAATLTGEQKKSL